MHHALRRTPRQGNQALAILPKITSLAGLWGMRPEHSNPVRGLERYTGRSRSRFYSDAEQQALGGPRSGSPRGAGSRPAIAAGQTLRRSDR
jgi:hypothetical protein